MSSRSTGSRKATRGKRSTRKKSVTKRKSVSRKKTERKKAARKKAAPKRATRKKTTAKRATGKKTAKKKTARKKATARKSTRKKPMRKPVTVEPDSDGQEVARALCLQVMRGEAVSIAEVGLVFADDPTLRKLNSEYRKIDKATDVLSFTYEDDLDDQGHRNLAGDIIISVPRLMAQAKRYKVSPGRELARLLTHGSLHLCGHDHVKLGERKRMRDREKLHMDSIGESEEDALTSLMESWAEELV